MDYHGKQVSQKKEAGEGITEEDDGLDGAADGDKGVLGREVSDPIQAFVARYQCKLSIIYD